MWKRFRNRWNPEDRTNHFLPKRERKTVERRYSNTASKEMQSKFGVKKIHLRLPAKSRYKIFSTDNVFYYTSDSLWKIWLVESIQSFIMSSSTSAWLLSPLECSPQKQNAWTLRFCSWGWIMWKMYNKTIIEFGFCMISWILKTSCLCRFC